MMFVHIGLSFIFWELIFPSLEMFKASSVFGVAFVVISLAVTHLEKKCDLLDRGREYDEDE